MKSISDLSILVVEDEPLQRAVLAGNLKRMGAQKVLEAADGREAIRLMEEHGVDLIFCDIGMPNMDGPQFIVRHVEQARNRPGPPRQFPMLVWVSVLGAGMLDSHIRLARNAGFAAVEALPKPLSNIALCYVVELAIALGKPRRQRRAGAEDALRNISDDDLLRAICDVDEFDVWYCPQISPESLRMGAAAAEVRWNHPRFRKLRSEQFTALIEQQGLGLVLFYRTVNHVLRVQQKLKAAGHCLPLSIKASAQTLQTPEIVDYLADRVRQHQLSPEQVSIVLTEVGAPVLPVPLSASLNRLRIKGFGLSLNGFGAGSANISMLAEAPFTGIHIDGGLIGQLLRHELSRSMVDSIFDIGRRLGLGVVACGVDDPETSEALRKMGCRMMQGDVAPPMKASDFLRAIRGGMHAPSCDARPAPA
ncbi:EAL domain-containing protein [Herbaspirillum sp. SJZ099]|uniref:EAL domain-containing response regulator n=1 Tax=Herbaspirillum sp. SJZ099 TaxID=2572916 RepID=UPI00119DFF3F|nr:EAL domain-containing protein [Herbaspirillum sp. SJZ099]TWC71431.1 EAL domain-containing protein (putative c-di-GMP-specific phosphodiesterase class I) [Herbaspirillum sp. SJZ099]